MKTSLNTIDRDFLHTVCFFTKIAHVTSRTHICNNTVQSTLPLVKRIQIFQIFAFRNTVIMIFFVYSSPLVQTFATLGRVTRFTYHNNIFRNIFSSANPRQNMFHSKILFCTTIYALMRLLLLLEPFSNRRRPVNLTVTKLFPFTHHHSIVCLTKPGRIRDNLGVLVIYYLTYGFYC